MYSKNSSTANCLIATDRLDETAARLRIEKENIVVRCLLLRHRLDNLLGQLTAHNCRHRRDLRKHMGQIGVRQQGGPIDA